MPRPQDGAPYPKDPMPPEVARTIFRSAFPACFSLGTHLDDALGMVAGVTDLISELAEWASFHGHDLDPKATHHAARACNLLITLAAAMADELGKHDRQTSRDQGGGVKS